MRSTNIAKTSNQHTTPEIDTNYSNNIGESSLGNTLIKDNINC